MEPRERKAQILGHAARLFGDKGYYDTSIADIIAAAGVARGTFYLYFESKRGIFEELLSDLLADLHDRIRTVETDEGSPSARSQLVDNIARVIRLFADERHMLSILLKGAAGVDKEFDAKLNEFYAEITRLMESSLTFGQEMGIVRQCDTRIAAVIALGVFKEVLRDLLENEERAADDPDRLAAEVLDIFSKGVLMDGVSIP
jgi:AcrR family transcriptional regulator